ncbi:hypothetical protein ACS0TY_027143 [Phlomoides rotata]
MERARHRKTKSASGIEGGIRQIQKQKAVPRLSSDSRSYIDGSNRDDMFMLELGQSSLGGVTGMPMKKLLAEEMSKDVEAKRRSPSIVAKLMGLEGLPSSRHAHRQQKRFSGSYQQKIVSINKKNNQMFDGRSNRRSTMEQQEFKDVYEDLEASHAANPRCSSRWSSNSILTKPEMALIRQKFIDAKRLSTDEDFQNSKELDDTLEMLDSNKDLLLKFLGQSDSLFKKHFHDLQVDPGSSPGSHIAVLKPLNSEKYESKSKAWRSDRDTSSKPHVASHLKREDGLLLEPHSRHRAHVSRSPSRIQVEEKNEEKMLPTRIVVLKPNPGKMQNVGTSCSSPSLSHDHLYSFKIKDHPSVGRAETVLRRRNESSYNVGHPKTMSKEAREIAQEITMRMIEGYDEMDAKSTGYRGYVGDESSYDANESDSDSESEVFKLSSRRSFDDGNLCRYLSPCLDESSANKEAKKQLSERWKMTHRYQDLEMVGRASTLGEMLSLPDKEIRPCHLNAKTNIGRASKRLGRKGEAAALDGPLGISSRDGWKDEICRNSSRSRSRSVPPSTGGRGRIIKRSSYHDQLDEDKYLMHSDSVRCGRSKVSKGKLRAVEDNASKDSKSRSKKSSRSYEHIVTSEIDFSSEVNFEIQMESNTKDLSDKQSKFQMPEKANTSGIPEVDVMIISEHGSTAMSSKSPEMLPKQPPSSLDCDIAASHNEVDFNLQELHNGPPTQGSPSSQCLSAELDSLECCKEDEHPSPNSVLEVPFTEDTSSSESFERVSAELHELRMQLQLLKMESGTYADTSTLPPIEEEVQLSPIVSERYYDLGAENWKYSYAVDVLIYSGFEDSNFDEFKTTWHSIDCPLDPKLFDYLEKQYNDESTSSSRSERRLLFDLINSALLESFDFRPWVMPKLAVLNLKCVKEDVRDAVEKLINEDDFFNKEITDKELDREMMWSDWKEVIEIIGNEMETLLIDDMIIEVICN